MQVHAQPVHLRLGISMVAGVLSLLTACQQESTTDISSAEVGDARGGLVAPRSAQQLTRSAEEFRSRYTGTAEMGGAVDGMALAQEADAPEFSTEAYDVIEENPFKQVVNEPLSTFSIDVDTASYSNVRRFLRNGSLPPEGAVRVEELINYFSYEDPAPEAGDEHPFRTSVELTGCPWQADHRLMRIGIKGREIPADQRPLANLVFLLDVSGSMNAPDKLPLLKQALTMLVRNLTENDQVAIVVYAGASGLVLDATPGDQQETILAAIEQFQAGGSTNGGAGIELAYAVAQRNFIDGGINRVILATDGDFNVGISDRSSLVRMIEQKAKSGVFLSVLGFGSGNLKDSQMEQLADRGNGNYAYLDSVTEARKVLVEQVGGTLVTIAKDVKIQVDFNPAQVAGYRLIGYENRMLAAEDFHDDTKDAGEIGAGHSIVALYQLVPAGIEVPGTGSVDPSKYQTPGELTEAANSDEWLTLKLRYKRPDESTSLLIEQTVTDSGLAFGDASRSTQFASAVAGFGLLLRNSAATGSLTYEGVREIAASNLGDPPNAYRQEFLELVETAKNLTQKNR